ncbi:hypothetical protein FACS189473_4370 [Spirochaetia bacterium]|nr:hypothetical protein FACS189473_4370 [Spirochaetia bacterium]
MLRDIVFYPLRIAACAMFWVLLVGLSPSTFAQIPVPSDVPGNVPPAESMEPVESKFPVEPFPLIPILETIRAGEIPWRPDWPVFMPPDAFTVSGPPPAEIALILESAPGEPPIEYLLRRSRDGLLTDFPVYLWGAFFQAALSFDSPSRISGFTIDAPVPWNIEFLEYADDDTLPAIARIGSAETWFLAVFRFTGAGASETWYDKDGTALSVFTFVYTQWDGKPLLRGASLTGPGDGDTRIEAYHYDSLGNMSTISTQDREFTARYRWRHPQYWERPYPAAIASTAAPSIPEPGPSSSTPVLTPVSHKLVLQWDERGFLTRLSRGRLSVDRQELGQQEVGGPPGGNPPPGDEAELDVRYEYTQDDHDNWIERREIALIRYGDYRIPYRGETIRRRITYFEPELRP